MCHPRSPVPNFAETEIVSWGHLFEQWLVGLLQGLGGGKKQPQGKGQLWWAFLDDLLSS